MGTAPGSCMSSLLPACWTSSLPRHHLTQVVVVQLTELLRQLRTPYLSPYRLPGTRFPFCWPGLSSTDFELDPEDSSRAVRRPLASVLPYDTAQGEFWEGEPYQADGNDN